MEEKKEQAKQHLAHILSLTYGLGLDEAYDTVKTCQTEIIDCLAGESMYKSPAEVIADYFSLPDIFLWIFL